ncbi:hypothetical protein [Plesiocystis pacifica]|nr:hypothetical protein [Plesiocystis pacifica]
MVVMSACGDSAHPQCDHADPIEAEGITFLEHEDSYARQCPGSFAAAQAHAQWVADSWAEGLDEPAALPDVQYQSFASKESECWSCVGEPGGVAGCATENLLWTTKTPDRHELSHAARGLQCASFFIEEGWAELYGDPFTHRPPQDSLEQALASVQELGYLGGQYYGLAARFVAFIIDTRGMSGLRALCGESMDTFADFQQGVEGALNESFDGVWSEFNDWPGGGASALRQELACELDEVGLPTPGAWTMDMSCSNSRVEGSLDTGVGLTERLQIVEGGSYSFEFTPSLDAVFRVELRSCARVNSTSDYHIEGTFDAKAMAPELILFPDVLPGDYVLRLESDGGPLPDEGVQVGVVAALLGAP